MKELLQNLVRLQSFELGETKEKNAQAVIAELRAKVPAQILGHYDRLVVRGKKGIVPVRNQTCTGCHMRLPIGVVNTLMHEEDIQLCDSCGRYLYLPAETPAAEPASAKPERKPRKSKRALHAA